MKQWYKLSKTCPSCKSQHLEYKVDFIYSKCFIKAEYKKQMTTNEKYNLFLKKVNDEFLNDDSFID